MEQAQHVGGVHSIRNRTVWILWTQGFDNAPDVVKLCLKSWQQNNPGWEIRALDEAALNSLIDEPLLTAMGRPDITPQVHSNIARLCLLHRYGGVWADSTLFCAEPLDAWFEPYVAEGFFAFRNPGRDRLMANWFLAANPDNVILDKLYQSYIDLFSDNQFADPKGRQTRFFRRVFSRLYSRNTKATVGWFGVPRTVFKIFPYLMFHYTFNRNVYTDPEVERVWSRVRAFPAAEPRRLTKLAKDPNNAATAVDLIDQGSSPLYKLNWRIDTEAPYWKTVLSHLGARLKQPAAKSA